MKDNSDLTALESSPMPTSRSRFGDHSRAPHSAIASSVPKLPMYLRRIILYPQMDFNFTFTQMVYLILSPSKVYKLTTWRHQTKNQWARDDPAFVVVLTAFLISASVAYALALDPSSVVGAVFKCVLYNCLLCYGSGVVIATIGWYVSNHYFKVLHSHSVEQDVEWMYAFDIHCNSFFPMFVALYVVQYLFLPLLLSGTIVATIFANALYMAAFSYYHYVSFLGYMYLPFLNKEKVTWMLYPIGLIIVSHILLCVINVNVARLWLSLFFGW